MGKTITGYVCLVWAFMGIMGLWNMGWAEGGGRLKTVASENGEILVSETDDPVRAAQEPSMIVFKKKQQGSILPKTLRNLGIEKVFPIFRQRNSGLSARLQNKRKILESVFYATLPPGLTPEKAIEKMSSDPDVAWAEPCYYRTIQQTPNDPSYYFQPYLPFIGANAAWDMTTGSQDVVIAVIDTGVDYTHADLSANIWANDGEIGGDGVDNDENGYVDDIRGWDFIDVSATLVYPGEDPGPPDNNPMDGHGHGTHVAGIAGAVGNNGTGVTGVCWRVRIMPLRAGYKNTSGNGVLPTTAIADALVYAADNGASVVNMSFGGYVNSQLEKAAIDYCVEAGVILVAASGNDKTDTPMFPACYDHVLAVAAVNQTNPGKASFSNFGLNIDVAAPGSNVFNLIPGGKYGYKSGTSMASPVVAGLAALVRSVHPDWGIEPVFLCLQSTSTSIDDANPLYAGMLGAGLVDASMAVQLDEALPRAGVAALFPLNRVRAGETVRIIPGVRNFSEMEEGVTVTLSTTDPLVTVTDGISVIGDIPNGCAVSGVDNDFTLDISPLAPANHTADVQVDISSPLSGLMASDVIPLNLNPLMTPPVMLTFKPGYTRDYHSGQVRSLPGGGGVAIFCSQSLTIGEASVFASVCGQDGGWELPLMISDDQSRNAMAQRSAVSEDGRVHVVYQGNVGDWDNEFFYTVRDPGTGSWSTPVRITDQAEIFSPEHSISLSAISIDPWGNPHLVFEDYRNGDAALYHMTYSGSQWTGDTLIHSFEAGKRPNRLTMMTDSTGTDNVLWMELLADGSYGIEMMRRLNGQWGDPAQVASGDISVVDAMMDGMDRIHIRYKSYNNGRMVCRTLFDGESWTPVSAVPDTFSLIDNCIGFVQAPDGLPVMALSQPADGVVDVYETKYDGSAWSDPVIVSRERDINLTYQGFAVDDLGNRYFIGRIYDNIRMRGDMFVQTSLFQDDAVPQRPVITQSQINAGENGDVLNAAWPAAGSDPVDAYEYAMGKVPGGTDLKPWTYAGTLTTVSLDLSGEPIKSGQEYYVNVRARKGVRLSPVAFAKMIRVVDLCPDDPGKTDPGVCGCGVLDSDSDSDGIMDCVDLCLNTPMGETVDEDGCDVSPPRPDPMGFAVPPSATGTGSITMAATVATDGNKVEYYFEETTGKAGGSDSGWQANPSYTDTGLTAGTAYAYRVKARDTSVNRNETASSAVYTATTQKSTKIGCGAAPMDGRGTFHPADTSLLKALLPLIPALITLSIWPAVKRRRSR